MDSSWLPFLIIFIMGSCFGMEIPSPCPQNQFLHPDGICCEFCGLGTHVFKPCLYAGSNPLCFACEMGTSYMDKPNKETMCKQCRVCDPESEVEDKECTFVYNRQCVCRDGFHRKGNKCMMDNTVEDKTDVRSAALFKHPTSSSTVFLPWWIWLPLPIGSILFALFMFLFAVEANAELDRKEEQISDAVTQLELEECVLDTKSQSVASDVEIHQAPRPTEEKRCKFVNVNCFQLNQLL